MGSTTASGKLFSQSNIQVLENNLLFCFFFEGFWRSFRQEPFFMEQL
jgi:hypothetical protein